MAYNISFMNNVTGLAETGEEFMSLTGVSGGLLLMAMLYISLFALYKSRGYDTIVSFVATSFINTVIAALFMFLGWVSWYYALIPFVLFMVSAITYYFQD